MWHLIIPNNNVQYSLPHTKWGVKHCDSSGLTSTPTVKCHTHHQVQTTIANNSTALKLLVYPLPRHKHSYLQITIQVMQSQHIFGMSVNFSWYLTQYSSSFWIRPKNNDTEKTNLNTHKQSCLPQQTPHFDPVQQLDKENSSHT